MFYTESTDKRSSITSIPSHFPCMYLREKNFQIFSEVERRNLKATERVQDYREGIVHLIRLTTIVIVTEQKQKLSKTYSTKETFL